MWFAAQTDMSSFEATLTQPSPFGLLTHSKNGYFSETLCALLSALLSGNAVHGCREDSTSS